MQKYLQWLGYRLPKKVCYWVSANPCHACEQIFTLNFRKRVGRCQLKSNLLICKSAEASCKLPTHHQTCIFGQILYPLKCMQVFWKCEFSELLCNLLQFLLGRTNKHCILNMHHFHPHSCKALSGRSENVGATSLAEIRFLSIDQDPF